MNCNCNTYNEAHTQFLDKNGLAYTLSLLNTIMNKKIKNAIDLIPTGGTSGGTSIDDLDLATDADIDNIFEKEVGPQ